MFVALGWMLLTGLQLARPLTTDSATLAATRRNSAVAPVRVAVWSDRENPYRRGEAAHVYLSAEQPSHVAVFRVDTDGRIRVLFPREPWGETYVRGERRFEVTGRGGRSFVVNDDPGIGYLLAIASPRPLNFGDIARGDRWDYRLIEGGRIRGDPYVALADVASRVAGAAAYDYDIAPYYVERRYDYPRFACYDCHAYAKYDDWDPYRQACARFRVVIYEDPRFYPYRSGRHNIVVARPARPGPRFVFRDADPRDPYVTHEVGSATGERRHGYQTGRTSQDVGGRGSVPAPAMSSAEPTARMAPPLRAVPSRPLVDDERKARRGQAEPAAPEAAPKGLRPVEDTRRRKPATAKPRQEPRSTGEPELRRRKP